MDPRFSTDVAEGKTVVLEEGRQAFLVDGTDRTGRNFQLNLSTELWKKETSGLQVGQLAVLGLVVGMRNAVASQWSLAGDVTATSHGVLLICTVSRQGRLLGFLEKHVLADNRIVLAQL